jgi:hypothetical protein
MSAALGLGSDVEAAPRMTVEAGVTTVPMSAFYQGRMPRTHLLRFCFCKRDEVLDEAVARLKAWRERGFSAAGAFRTFRRPCDCLRPPEAPARFAASLSSPVAGSHHRMPTTAPCGRLIDDVVADDACANAIDHRDPDTDRCAPIRFCATMTLRR